MHLSGTVVHGKGRGKELGFATANLLLEKEWNENGTFLAYAIVNEKKLPALVFNGVADTFDDVGWTCEVHILDFGENLYDQELQVEILQKLRDNKKFESVEKLVEAIKKDIEEARMFFRAEDTIL